LNHFDQYNMKLSQFRFKLPEHLIAQFPTPYRDEARMMVVHRKTGEIEHRHMPDIVEYFGEGDTFIFNDTKVFPARMYAKKEKTLANIEIFLIRELNHENRFWDVLVDPARKIRVGNKLFLDEDTTIVAEVIDNTTARGRTLRFLTDYDNSEFTQYLYSLGQMPLPKYIHRPMPEDVLEEFEKAFPDMTPREMDNERYQTIFASKIGAVAVPAAGLHFSKNLLKRMEIAGVDQQFITSHMSLGNFKPIDVEDLTKHKVDSEQIIIGESVVKAVNHSREVGGKICPVGTEVMRALEHVVGTNGQLKAYDGWTNKFIFPPYEFTAANTFFVNFYFPQSSQFLMVATFGGYDTIMHAYDVAVKEEYRFGDYGDAMLIVD